MKSTRQQEIEAVQQLGENIGYGNLMDIASAIWAVKLRKNGTSQIGAFYSAAEWEFIIKFKKVARKKRDERIKEIEGFLI